MLKTLTKFELLGALCLLLLLTLFTTPIPTFGQSDGVHEWVDIYKTYVKEQEFIDAAEAKKRWGDMKFDSKVFKESGWQKKSLMTANLVGSNLLIGKTRIEMEEILGPTDGYFWDDHIPAYVVEDGRETLNLNFQIVCLLDADGKIKKVLIHKKKINRNSKSYKRELQKRENSKK